MGCVGDGRDAFRNAVVAAGLPYGRAGGGVVFHCLALDRRDRHAHGRAGGGRLHGGRRLEDPQRVRPLQPLRHRGAARARRRIAGPARARRTAPATRGRARMTRVRGQNEAKSALRRLNALAKCPVPLGPRRLVWPRTSAFHADNVGSNPAGDTQYLRDVAGDVPRCGECQCRYWCRLGFRPARGRCVARARGDAPASRA